MATKIMYRCLRTDTGKIEVREHKWYSDIIVLDEIKLEYDDEVKEEHREQLIKAIEKNIEDKTTEHNAEMFKLRTMRDQLLRIGHEKEAVDGEFIPADKPEVKVEHPQEPSPPPTNFDFDEDIPF